MIISHFKHKLIYLLLAISILATNKRMYILKHVKSSTILSPIIFDIILIAKMVLVGGFSLNNLYTFALKPKSQSLFFLSELQCLTLRNKALGQKK